MRKAKRYVYPGVFQRYTTANENAHKCQNCRDGHLSSAARCGTLLVRLLASLITVKDHEQRC